jgi:hypothetical protein
MGAIKNLMIDKMNAEISANNLEMQWDIGCENSNLDPGAIFGKAIVYCRKLEKQLTDYENKESVMLLKKLTREEQSEILSTLFGFAFIDDILIDEDGQEFYATPTNQFFSFGTLAEIFSYTAHRAKDQGYADALWNVRKALGLNK